MSDSLKQPISYEALLERLATGRAKEISKFYKKILLFLFLPVKGEKVKIVEKNGELTPILDEEGYPSFPKHLIPLLLASNLNELKNGNKSLKDAMNKCLELNLAISLLEKNGSEEGGSWSIVRQYANTLMLSRLGLSTDVFAELLESPLFHSPSIKENEIEEKIDIEKLKKLKTLLGSKE